MNYRLFLTSIFFVFSTGIANASLTQEDGLVLSTHYFTQNFNSGFTKKATQIWTQNGTFTDIQNAKSKGHSGIEDHLKKIFWTGKRQKIDLKVITTEVKNNKGLITGIIQTTEGEQKYQFHVSALNTEKGWLWEKLKLSKE